MLQEILTLFDRAKGQPLSKSAVGAKLDIPPEVLEHMLHTLVRRGHLVTVEGGCDGCEICPLKPVCAGIPAPAQKAYALAPLRRVAGSPLGTFSSDKEQIAARPK